MDRWNLIWCLLPFVLLLGCSKDDMQDSREDFATLHGGSPFKGTTEGIRSESGRETHRWNGSGRMALIERSADSVSLVLMADFGDVGEVNLKIRGAYGTNSFQATGSNLNFRITDGKIDGKVANQQQKFDFSGTMSPTKSVLSVHIEFLEGQEGFPQGAVLEIRFETERNQDNISDDGGGCDLRLVPIWGPSGMTMGMVPDC